MCVKEVVRNLMKSKNPAKNIKDACEASRGKSFDLLKVKPSN
jgi:hypothetical protein